MSGNTWNMQHKSSCRALYEKDTHSQVHLVVVREGPGPATVGLPLVMLNLDEVDSVKHDRNNGHDTIGVDSTDVPSGPTALYNITMLE
jgi:hypothetical protein